MSLEHERSENLLAKVHEVCVSSTAHYEGLGFGVGLGSHQEQQPQRQNGG